MKVSDAFNDVFDGKNVEDIVYTKVKIALAFPACGCSTAWLVWEAFQLRIKSDTGHLRSQIILLDDGPAS